MSTTKAQAVEHFDNCVLPAVVERFGDNDKIAIREAWSEYTDFLCKEGEISVASYNNWTNPY